MAEGKADGKVSDIKKERFDRQDRDRTVTEPSRRLPSASIEDRDFEAKTGGEMTLLLPETTA